VRTADFPRFVLKAETDSGITIARYCVFNSLDCCQHKNIHRQGRKSAKEMQKEEPRGMRRASAEETVISRESVFSVTMAGKWLLYNFR